VHVAHYGRPTVTILVFFNRYPVSSLVILSPSVPFLLISTSHLLPFIRLLSRLISPLYFIYLLSILVEVLLRLLTYGGDLVLLYLVSED
jgi:hypothetical protein